MALPTLLGLSPVRRHVKTYAVAVEVSSWLVYNRHEQAPALASRNGTVCSSRASGTYFWGALVRLDVLDGPAATQLIFYGPAALHVTAEPLRQDAETAARPLVPPPRPASATISGAQPSDVPLGSASFAAGQAGWQNSATDAPVSHNHDSSPGHGTKQQTGRHVALPVAGRTQNDAEADGPCFGAGSVAARGGLVVAKQVSIAAAGQDGPLADIAISGLAGWVAIYAPAQRGRIVVRIWVPRGIEAYVRPPMPAGLETR